MSSRAKPRILPAMARRSGRQHGLSLIVVLMILVIVSLIGVAGTQSSILGERSVRFDRDQKIAFEAAEIALRDAEAELAGTTTAARAKVFTNREIGRAVTGCAIDAVYRGFCATGNATKPVWMTVSFDDVSAAAPTVAVGTYTGRPFTTGVGGVSPARAPRYIIEPLQTTGSGQQIATDQVSRSGMQSWRVTAMGFGTRDESRAVIQAVYLRDYQF